MIIGGGLVERSMIYSYFEENMKYLEMFLNYKHFGEPYSGGWMTYPAHLLDIIKILEIESGKKYGR